MIRITIEAKDKWSAVAALRVISDRIASTITKEECASRATIKIEDHSEDEKLMPNFPG